ncbi:MULTISPECIES: SDR family NAD(P)-dependent oxidoreductase [Pseudomonas]|uniref:SDR family NAD(P)-dependent oxidoreductase n=1 Tax=Pseudomonas TaxID=286 RepID=UPI0015E5D7F6|nr:MULTISPECIES: SDR family NAD(P)-dependent oxidoreductase [Pseudomonas]CAH0143760.1 C-factor [Pseudomonas carnis]CAH0153817.1 C-factor [Pseudomonas carnis]CAH0213555.1 C-factor [Pseudomonas carnis]CAH0226532.1 C-factor [Pseudomonas carnis]
MRVIITGATGGYGRALCRQAKLNGYSVLAVSKSPDKLESLVRCGLADDLFVLDYLDGNLDANLTNLESFMQSKEITSVDLLINNAGIGSKRHSLFDENAEDFRRALEVNCIGPGQLTRRLAASFSLATVVNISSRRGSVAQNADEAVSKLGCSYTYRISKAALNMLSLCIANELGDRLQSYTVHPGRLRAGIGVQDAELTAQDSAVRLFQLVASRPDPSLFYSLETEQVQTLPW